MANITGASLGPIYDRLSNAPTYHPLEADTFADWSLEAGDIVTVTRDNKGYQSPVHSSVMTWKKQPQMKLSSTGNEKRDAISRMSQKKFRNGSSSLRANNYQHYYVEDNYKQMRAGLELTSSSASLYVDNRYAQMKSGLNLTSSSASLYVDNRYKQMRAGLDLTSSSAALYVDNKYAQMKSGLNLTSSSAALYVENKYAQMRSGLQLSSSSAALYTLDSYNQMRSGLSLSTSHVSLYVDNRYSQMKSGLSLTSSSAALYVNDRYNQMKSGLDLTSSSAALYVDNKYAQMRSGLDVTSSSAALYTRNRTTRAYIMTRINADGEGEALIEADKVSITGTTTINDVMTISDNKVSMKKSVRIDDGDIMAKTLTLRDAGSSDSINATDLAGVIKSASVSGNVLTLTPVHGDAITFSKATSLSGSWSGRNYTVTAKQNGTSVGTKTGIVYDGLVPTGSVTKSGKTVYRDFIVYSDDGEGEADVKIMQKNIGIDATGVYNDGWNGARGAMEIPTSDIGAFVDGNYAKAVVKKPDADGASTKTDYDLTININDSFRPQGTTQDIRVAEIKYGDNVVARKTISGGSVSVSDYGIINGSSWAKQTTGIGLGLGDSIDLYGGYTTDGTNWTLGDKITVTSPGNPYPTSYTLKCTYATPSGGGMYDYTFEYKGTSGQFAAGSSYTFHR